MNKTCALSISLLMWLILLVTASAEAQQKLTIATPEGRELIIKSVDYLEKNPYADNSKKAREILTFYAINSPELQVRVRSLLKTPKNDDGSLIFGQYMFAMMAYQVEQSLFRPEEDRVEIQLAGVKGALRTYAVMRSAKPKLKMKDLDSLAALSEEGLKAEIQKRFDKSNEKKEK